MGAGLITINHYLLFLLKSYISSSSLEIIKNLSQFDYAQFLWVSKQVALRQDMNF